MNTEVVTPSSGALAGLVTLKIERVLELARTHLQMEVSFLSQFTSDKQIYRAADGDAESFGITLGDGPELPTTYCQKMVEGHIPNAVPDSAAEPVVRDLATTIDRRIGSYIGVPLRLSDGSLYGTFCCLGHNAESLSSRDVGFMALLAEVLVEELDSQHRLNQERSLIAGILTTQSIAIAYQPIVNLHDGRRLGLEALSRFSAGPPDVIFQTAHAAGLGVDLEALAVRCAITVLPRLATDQYLAVNLSPAAALELSSRAVDRPDLDLGRIVLEVTETAAVESYETLRRSLAPLREQGLRLAIDDAGAGYASLHHIVELRPDIIKIDRSLINGMALNRSRRSAVRAFTALAEDLGAATVAEGVETTPDLKTARELGITAAQGYLLGRPTLDPADLFHA
ncbi:EAL domain-containing protein [Arthrobacter sp. PAMC25284]|uniref:sensor domain-containing phosphodiesterase n=1 Tax=Arthrobacter sp. PAMC25284 TaxID=2861279 RepID=UPI001C62753C|nr:EAL domain-containing protein [Arthrobacter sp. PAMC25284]QYF89126.1 EAL domain-containing protein [Arthrobacter sp. PAMC25284]